MERDYFIQNFLPEITNLKWVEEEVAKGRVWSDALDRFRHAILEKQTELANMEKETRISIEELKDINKNMVSSEKETAAAKQEMIQANLRLVISIAKKIHQPRLAVSRFDSGGQHRPDEGRGQV